MRNSWLIALLLPLQVFSQSFVERTTTASNVRLSVTNVGTFGNAFRGYRRGTGVESCEFPAGSATEHLFEGGIWIGGKENGANIRVSTSAYDAPQGYAPGRGGFEFTAEVGGTSVVRSTLFDNPNFSPQAVSHQDYVSNFSDKNVIIPGTSIPIAQHLNPMNLEVQMETYNWNYNFSNFFVIVNMQIINDGTNYFDDLHIGLWNNTVVRNLNITPAGAGGAAFYSQGGNGYIDSLYMAYCYDSKGDEGFSDSYIGQKFLGAEDKFGFHHPEIDSAVNSITGGKELDTLNKSHYNAWIFNNSADAIYAFPTNDNQRYLKLTEGLNDHPCWNDPQNGQCLASINTDIQADLNAVGNRSDLVSVGPFRRFSPGDTITLSFAYILAKKNEDGNPNSDNNITQKEYLVNNASWAQTAFNGEDKNFNGILDPGEDTDGDGQITRFILPAPPAIPKTRIVAENNTINIYWDKRSESSIDPITQEKDFEGYRVYLSKLGFDVVGTQNLEEDFTNIAAFDLAGNNIFFDTGLDSILLDAPVYFDGDTTAYWYLYTIENIQNGWQYATAVTAFDKGDKASNLEPLESSILSNSFRTFAGTPINSNLKTTEPFVYPNPYYYGSSWEGQSNFQEESRKIMFANLPKRCVIRVFTVAGDFIDEINHDENYNGSDIRWFDTFGSENPDENTFSGGEHGWDLLSLDSQIIARGIYMYSVRDLDTGEQTLGKFIIIK